MIPTKEDIQARYLRGEINYDAYMKLLGRMDQERRRNAEEEQKRGEERFRRQGQMQYEMKRREGWQALPEEDKQQYRDRQADVDNLNRTLSRLQGKPKGQEKKSLTAQAESLKSKVGGYKLDRKFYGMK